MASIKVGTIYKANYSTASLFGCKNIQSAISAGYVTRIITYSKSTYSYSTSDSGTVKLTAKGATYLAKKQYGGLQRMRETAVQGGLASGKPYWKKVTVTEKYNINTGKWEVVSTSGGNYQTDAGQSSSKKQTNNKKGSSGTGGKGSKGNSSNSAGQAKQANKAKTDGNFMVWLKYSYFNDSQASDADWKSGKPGIDIPDAKINEWYNEYSKDLQSAKGKNKSAKTTSLLNSVKEKGSNKGNAILEDIKKQDVAADENGTSGNNIDKTVNKPEDWERTPQYWVLGADGKTRRVLTDKEIEDLKNAEIDPSTGKPVWSLGGAGVVVVQQKNGDTVIVLKEELEDASKTLDSIDAQCDALDNVALQAYEGDQQISLAEAAELNVAAFDPRLGRFDALLLEGNNDSGSVNVIVPFSSNTVASCFSDMVFKLDNDTTEKWKTSTKAAKDNLNKIYSEDAIERLNDKTTAAGTVKNVDPPPSDSKLEKIQKTGIYDPNYKEYKTLGVLHGTGSLMNPYAITRLYGALGDIKVSEGGKNGNGTIMPESNRMYDVRDQRRFYDIVTDSSTAGDDFLSVSQPTTTNIIKYSNKDKWGRTPYTFTDFVFCKYWNIIPNNRLITLRKYAAPCLDNLNFEGMQSKNDGYGWSATDDQSQENMFAPVATAVGYFGEGTDNTLSELLSMSTGLPWGDVEAHIWTVTGDQGSNEAQVTDDEINGGLSGFGFLDNIAKDIQSFGKFVGLFEKGGFNASQDQGVVDKHFENMVDPYTDGPFNNRILGPTNKISKMKQRAKQDSGEAEDLKFTHNIEVTFKYISRPIGGINTKAAMLDIMANLLEIGSASAVFWGGAHKFKIHPRTYPWGGAPGQRGIMHKLYQGQIFGENGALHDLMKGIISMGTDSNGSFSWDAITTQLKNVFQGITGAISQAINSIASSIGIGEDMVNKFTKKGEDMVANMSSDPEAAKAEQEKGKQKMNNLMNNTEQMLKARMIKATTMPTVQGMRALLIGNPVGNWHLTIGNPLNPIAVIGNLVCSEMNLKFSDDIGPDDFPTELTCKFTLEHGMARDKDAIESMFNRGAGKIYNLPDSLRVTSDYETKVDQYTGTKSWRMGMAYTSQASLLGSSGYAGAGMHSSTPSNIPNSVSATIFTPKFTPVIVPDSGSWEELKEKAVNINTDMYNHRGVFKANLATRKQLI